MKNRIIHYLQRFLGFERYLFLFSLLTYSKLRWDKNEKDFLKIFSLIKEDGLILDIGANIGVMTIHFAKRCKMSQVLAFEPIPHNLNILKRVSSFYKLSNVSILNSALSDSEGSLQMIMPIINGSRKHGLCHIKGSQEKKYETFEEFEVPVKKLDNILADDDYQQKKVVAIKIDVEGHEFNVLNGAEHVLKKDMPIIYIELWPGEERNRTIKYLTTLGYQCKISKKNKLVDFQNQETQNFFFVPEK